jgi:hypothetical protein
MTVLFRPAQGWDRAAAAKGDHVALLVVPGQSSATPDSSA